MLAGRGSSSPHWTGIVWLGAQAVLRVIAATTLFGMVRSPSMTQLVWGVEAEPKAVADDTRPRH